jgi:hypothetical protein
VRLPEPRPFASVAHPEAAVRLDEADLREGRLLEVDAVEEDEPCVLVVDEHDDRIVRQVDRLAFDAERRREVLA